MTDNVIVPRKLWNFIYATLWEASNWVPYKRHFKKMIVLKAQDLMPEIDEIQTTLKEKP